MHKIETITADPGTQETALHQAPYSNTNPDDKETPKQATKNTNKHQHHANTTLTTTQQAPSH